MSQAWELHRDEHVANLDRSRNPDRARAQMRPRSQWPAASRVRRSAALSAKRGRLLTDDEMRQLGDDLPLQTVVRSGARPAGRRPDDHRHVDQPQLRPLRVLDLSAAVPVPRTGQISRYGRSPSGRLGFAGGADRLVPARRVHDVRGMRTVSIPPTRCRVLLACHRSVDRSAPIGLLGSRHKCRVASQSSRNDSGSNCSSWLHAGHRGASLLPSRDKSAEDAAISLPKTHSAPSQIGRPQPAP